MGYNLVKETKAHSVVWSVNVMSGRGGMCSSVHSEIYFPYLLILIQGYGDFPRIQWTESCVASVLKKEYFDNCHLFSFFAVVLFFVCFSEVQLIQFCLK